jgi:hypothetical protein
MVSFAAAEVLEVLETADMQSTQIRAGSDGVGVGVDGKSMGPHRQWGWGGFDSGP